MNFMSDRAFLDTNVLVYAYDRSAPRKQVRAQELLKQGLEEDSAVLSVQVLGEFFVTVTRKIRTPLSLAEAREVVDMMAVLPLVDTDRPLNRRAIEICERHQISYWDALIVAAAQRASCGKVLSEDLQSGATYDGVRIENPF